MKKTILYLGLILFIGQSNASSEIIELKDVHLNNNLDMEHDIVYFGKYGKEDKLCNSLSDDSSRYCYGDELFKANNFEKGIIKSFQPIEKTYYNYIEIDFLKNKKAYLKIEKDLDIQDIYGDSYPIMKYSQYKMMKDFKPTPLVNDSKIMLLKKTYLSNNVNYNDDIKSLYYIDNNNLEYAEEDIETYRDIYEYHIKNPTIIDSLSKLSVSFEKESLKTNVSSKNSFNMPISPRVLIIKEKLYLILDLKHFQNVREKWIFPNSVDIIIDEKKVTIDNLKFKKKDLSDGIILEHDSRILIENELEIIKEIIKSKKSVVVFNGKNNKSEIKITRDDKKEMLEILKIYYLIKREITQNK